MIRLALRSVRARLGRVVLTSLAIVASTAFLSGTFIFRDTVQRTFNALFADVFERVDGYVQSSNSVEGFLRFERRDRLPVAVVDQVRAVGMTRTQVWMTVSWESVITSLLGAVLGVLLGLLSGFLLVLALRDQGITVFSVPVLSTIVILIVSFIVGVIAAVLPARRATKVDIIEAIATT